jgi:hypothetical protein
MPIAADEVETETLGLATTCTATVVEAFNPPPVAVMVSVPVVNAVVLAALSVSVELVLLTPLGENVAELQVAVTPAGIPVTAKITWPEYAPAVVVVTPSVAVPPFMMATLAAAALTLRLGAEETVSATVVVATMPPLVPVMVMVEVPATAAEVTVNVAVALVPAFAEAGLKLSVTPLGAVAVRAGDPVNPPVPVTATVNVADLPLTTVSDAAEA